MGKQYKIYRTEEPYSDDGYDPDIHFCIMDNFLIWQNFHSYIGDDSTGCWKDLDKVLQEKYNAILVVKEDGIVYKLVFPNSESKINFLLKFS